MSTPGQLRYVNDGKISGHRISLPSWMPAAPQLSCQPHMIRRVSVHQESPVTACVPQKCQGANVAVKDGSLLWQVPIRRSCSPVVHQMSSPRDFGCVVRQRSNGVYVVPSRQGVPRKASASPRRSIGGHSEAQASPVVRRFSCPHPPAAASCPHPPAVAHRTTVHPSSLTFQSPQLQHVCPRRSVADPTQNLVVDVAPASVIPAGRPEAVMPQNIVGQENVDQAPQQSDSPHSSMDDASGTTINATRFSVANMRGAPEEFTHDHAATMSDISVEQDHACVNSTISPVPCARMLEGVGETRNEVGGSSSWASPHRSCHDEIYEDEARSVSTDATLGPPPRRAVGCKLLSPDNHAAGGHPEQIEEEKERRQPVVPGCPPPKRPVTGNLLKRLRETQQHANRLKWELQDTRVAARTLQDVTNELQAECAALEAAAKKTLCVICFERDVGCVFLPCGHVVCCAVCGESCAVCPCCRDAIDAKARVYLP